MRKRPRPAIRNDASAMRASRYCRRACGASAGSTASSMSRPSSGPSASGDDRAVHANRRRRPGHEQQIAAAPRRPAAAASDRAGLLDAGATCAGSAGAVELSSRISRSMSARIVKSQDPSSKSQPLPTPNSQILITPTLPDPNRLQLRLPTELGSGGWLWDLAVGSGWDLELGAWDLSLFVPQHHHRIDPRGPVGGERQATVATSAMKAATATIVAGSVA